MDAKVENSSLETMEFSGLPSSSANSSAVDWQKMMPRFLEKIVKKWYSYIYAYAYVYIHHN